MFGDGGPIVDGIFAVGSSVLALLLTVLHSGFRKGSSWFVRVMERETGRFLRQSYAALPGALMVVGGAVLGLSEFTNVLVDGVIAGAAVLWLLVVVWSLKELHWPTLRRTPDWLQVKLQVDIRFRNEVVGRRTPPW